MPTWTTPFADVIRLSRRRETPSYALPFLAQALDRAGDNTEALQVAASNVTVRVGVATEPASEGAGTRARRAGLSDPDSSATDQSRTG